MAEKFIEKVENVLKEVCELTDTNCSKHLSDFKENGNLPALVTSMFITLDRCNTEKCKKNTPKILETLDKFIYEG